MTHPHDLALLYDLLDERLAPSAAEELRRRIAEEPELASAWDELQRMREGLRALPAPAVPKGFLESVKARAGIPLAAPAASSAPPSANAASAGKVLRLPRWALVAAGVGLVAGLAGYLAATREGANEATPVETAARENEKKFEDAAARRKSMDEVRAAKELEDREAPSDAASEAGRDARRAGAGAVVPVAPPPGTPAGPPPTVRFGNPGGAIPPGMRQPTDAPPPPPPPVSRRPGERGVAGGPPVPPPTPSVPPPERLDRGERDGDGGPPPEGTFAYVREGVDEVWVLYAGSVDEARAEVSLLVVAPTPEGAPTPAGVAWKKSEAAAPPALKRYQGLPVVRLVETAKADDVLASRARAAATAATGTKPAEPAAGAAPAMPGHAAGRGASAPSGPAGGEAGAVPQEAQVVLGSFLLDVTAEQWARVTAGIDVAQNKQDLGGARGEAKPGAPGEGYLAKTGPAKDKAAPPSAPAAAPPSTPPPPAPAPVASPAMGEPTPTDAKGLRRRVRILVLPPPPTSGR